jgi:hypothetical protein
MLQIGLISIDWIHVFVACEAHVRIAAVTFFKQYIIRCSSKEQYQPSQHQIKEKHWVQRQHPSFSRYKLPNENTTHTSPPHKAQT